MAEAPRSLTSVMRLLGILALVAPVAVGIFFLTDPNLTASWVDDGSRSMVAAECPTITISIIKQ